MTNENTLLVFAGDTPVQQHDTVLKGKVTITGKTKVAGGKVTVYCNDKHVVTSEGSAGSEWSRHELDVSIAGKYTITAKFKGEPDEVKELVFFVDV